MTTAPRIGILGGTLDPMHLGHVETALAARRTLALDGVIVLPSHVPPHRQQPSASAYHRFAMAALSINGLDGLTVSDEELFAPGPSYTADTLDRLHARGLASTQIFFITGADAFAEIATWHRFPEVLELSHFVVVSRPGHSVADLPRRVPAIGSRFVTGGMTGAGVAPGVFLVDAQTPDVSSTEIRRRLRSGERVTGMVSAAVEAHILQHGLYSSLQRVERLTADHLHGEN